MIITNPILPGFNPDPSILRKGSDYYIATSTFEWFPGVQIHHSRDLANWELVTRPLTNMKQLEMKGNPDSGGIWAPCLTFADDLFWLIYTDVKHLNGSFKVTHNYLVTASDIRGPWSDPIYLNSSGFDPSLFHDDDGRKWLVNQDWDWRPGRNHFAGILLQEFDSDAGCLVGPIRRIFTGTEKGKTEGPHIYKHDGRYYLLTAEGGTGHEHCVTMARSSSLYGPYETDPENPILTSWEYPEAELKKAGHADLVETDDGWYMVHLCSRPIAKGVRGGSEGWSILGRETSIQKMTWTDEGWLRLMGGGRIPKTSVPAPRIPGADDAATEPRDFLEEFNESTLSVHWQTLRRPVADDIASLSARPGFLRLYGQDPPVSRFNQALIARRQQARTFTAETILDFQPEDDKQMAGLICIYSTVNLHYLYVTCGPSLGILTVAGGEESFPLAGSEIELPETGALHLRAAVDHAELRFYWSVDGVDWRDVGIVLDQTILSDEMGPGWGFTGAFVGICCQDLSGMGRHADFERFSYREIR
ncbi:MAG: glycoside hydrolase family 43 protein [Spirochaetaceae bacterium]|nr:glycoside hydrolase family 43 protein [Spirochaetaceae bacterium]